jgi:cell division control protein 6
VIGPAGSGKSSTLKLFGDKFEEEASKRRINLKHVYINLKLEGGKRVVLYRNLLRKVDQSLASSSLSAEEMLKNLVEYLQLNRKLLLLTVDEIDYYVTHFRDEGIVYDLTRLGELSTTGPSGIVGATFLARDRRFHETLDDAELSTLGRVINRFPPYEAEQIAEILEKRAADAMSPGSCPREVLEFIGDLTASPPVKGDMRYALDLLLYAGNLADNLGNNTILREHIRKVHSETCHSITSEDVLNLPEEERLMLISVVRTLKVKKASYISLKELRGAVGNICEEYKFKPFSEDDLEDLVQDLADRGIIDSKGVNRIGISGVSLSDVGAFLDNVMEKTGNGLGSI